MGLKKGSKIYFPNEKVKVRVGNVIGRGGQAVVWKAGKYVVKEFSPVLNQRGRRGFSAKHIMQRLCYLRDLHLDRKNGLIVPPIDVIQQGDVVIALYRYVDGVPLEKVIEGNCGTRLSLLEALQIAYDIASCLDECERCGISHGDISANNVLVVLVSPNGGSYWVPYLIDIDNFVALNSSVPHPTHYGQHLFMAPEIWHSALKGQERYPDLFSDRYSLAVLLHWLLLLRHPHWRVICSGKNFRSIKELGAQLLQEMEAGWADDPYGNGTTEPNGIGGYPVSVLDYQLITLLRSGLSTDPGSRPSAGTWKKALEQSIRFTAPCPRCNALNIVDALKKCCWSCKTPLPDPALKLPSGLKRLPRSVVTIGRDLLGGLPYISRQQLRVRALPLLLQVCPLGRNPVYLVTAKKRVRMSHKHWYHLRIGDVMDVCGVEVRVVAA